jgi:peroxiredoxin Q/BCP
MDIFGFSKDSLVLHKKFCVKETLIFLLLSDKRLVLLNELGVWKEKSPYGRKYFRAERSPFLIQNGIIIREWCRVKGFGYVSEVLEAVKTL